jgi:hypothetical protein
MLDARQEKMLTMKTDIDRAMAATKVDCSRMAKIFAAPKAKAKAKAKGKGKTPITDEEGTSVPTTPAESAGSPASL